MAEISDAGTGTIEDLLDKARAEAEAETATADEKPKRSRRPRASTSKRSLKEPLTDFYTTLGAGVFMLNQADGFVILENAEKMAESLDNWGKANPQVHKALERLCTTGAFGAVAAAHAPVILAILNNHNVIATIMGKNADKDSDNQTSEFEGAPTVDPSNSNGYVAPTGRITPVVVEAR